MCEYMPNINWVRRQRNSEISPIYSSFITKTLMFVYCAQESDEGDMHNPDNEDEREEVEPDEDESDEGPDV